MLNGIDLYGKKVELNIDGKNKTITSSFGGIVTIIFILVTMGYSGGEFYKMIWRVDPEFVVSDGQIDPVEIENKTMMDFDDSFNMIVGITNKTVDWFNNPYFSFKVYEMTNKWAPVEANISMNVCTQEQLSLFLTDTAIKYYPNALCFSNKT